MALPFKTAPIVGQLSQFQQPPMSPTPGIKGKKPIKQKTAPIAKSATRIMGRPLNAQNPFGSDAKATPLSKALSGI